MTPTVADRLVKSLRARSAVPDGQTPPAAILWPDPKEEWRGLLSVLRDAAPELLVLGDYNPDTGTGPAIWLRCVVDGTLPAPKSPSTSSATVASAPTAVPILYLPGVRREELRAGTDCPDHVKPLVELMYRGALWHHPNGRPWTPGAFMRHTDKGLGLDVARDSETGEALTNALPEVARLPVAQLEGRRLDADDFNRLLAGDLERDVLRWIADADDARRQMGAKWGAFCSRCRNELELDPEHDVDVVAGVKLARSVDGWMAVWGRFAEAPSIHAGVVEVLRRSRPPDEFALEPDRWPDLNDAAEVEARKALASVPKHPPNDARQAVLALEKAHGFRRDWLWASLGHSPIAQLLEPLARLAEATTAPVGGSTPSDAADHYANSGWQADAAAQEALARAASLDEPLVGLVAQVVRHLLEPWMESAATAFQSAWERSPVVDSTVEAAPDECIVFVDGLRYEAGRRLAERLEANGCTAQVSRRWAALPTVTATAKPAVAPVADQVSGGALGPDFRPVLAGAPRPGAPRQDGSAQAADQPRPADAAHLRRAVAQRGYQVFAGDNPEMPGEADARGWMETGEIDKVGHDHVDSAPTKSATFAQAVEAEISRLSQRIAGLLDLGWRSVRVVTDHGWLWLPGGLPMVSLPKHLTASKWARCAAVSGDSKTGDALRFSWRWNAAQWFATPPGIACFSKRDAYAHGGVSPQECLIPDIVVKRGSSRAQPGPTAVVQSITWRRLRCFVEVKASGTSGGPPVTADLRLGTASGPSVAAAPKPVADDGSVSLVLAGDEHEEATLALVVTDADGRVLAHRSTRPGTDS